MSVDLCEHDLPLRACEICGDAADLLGKGDNVLISRVYLTAWVREAHRYQDAGKKLEALEKENAALQVMLEKCNSKFIVELEAENAALQKDADRYRHIAKLIGSIFVHGNFKAETHNERELEKCLREVGCFYETLEQFDATIDAAIAKEVK